MPQSIIIPQDLSSFLKHLPREQESAFSLVLAKDNLPRLKLKKKSFGERILFTANIDIGRHAHRAIFELVDHEGRESFLLRKVAVMHDYIKAVRWIPMGRVNADEIRQLYKGNFYSCPREGGSEVLEEEPNDENKSPARTKLYHQSRLIELTPAQEEILGHHTYPLLLVGLPGSGKTLLAMSAFQERVLSHAWDEETEMLKLLYVTESDALKHAFQRAWDDFLRHHFRNGYAGAVLECMTINEYTQAYASLYGLKVLQPNEFESFRQLPEDKKKELLLHAPILANDLKDKNDYAQSRYQNIGERNSFVTKNDKEAAYKQLCTILGRIIEDKQMVVPGLSQLRAEETYDLIVVDEVQQVLLTMLHHFLASAKHHQVMFMGDDFQKTNGLSSLSCLTPSVHQVFGIKCDHQTLHVTKRLEPEVAALVSQLICLNTHIRGGNSCASLYGSLEAIQPKVVTQQPSLYFLPALQTHLHDAKHHQAITRNLSEFKTSQASQAAASAQDEQRIAQEKSLARIGEDASAAAIVLHREDETAARILIQGANVFVASQAVGLEFSTVLLFISEHMINQFYVLSAKMKGMHGVDWEVPLKPRSYLPTEKTNAHAEELELLNELIVACSRTKGALHVYVESPKDTHRIQCFWNWFLRQFRQTQSSGNALAQTLKVSHRQDWLRTIHDYINTSNLTQASSVLRDKFALRDDEISAYIHCCQNNLACESIEALQRWKASRLSQQDRPKLPGCAQLPSTKALTQSRHIAAQTTPLQMSAAASSKSDLSSPWCKPENFDNNGRWEGLVRKFENQNFLNTKNINNIFSSKATIEQINWIVFAAEVTPDKRDSIFSRYVEENKLIAFIDGISLHLSKISSRGLNARLPASTGDKAETSCAYWLCGSKEGQKLLAAHPGLLSHILPETLNARLPASAGEVTETSCAYGLCRSKEASALLRTSQELNNQHSEKRNAERQNRFFSPPVGQVHNQTPVRSFVAIEKRS